MRTSTACRAAALIPVLAFGTVLRAQESPPPAGAPPATTEAAPAGTGPAATAPASTAGPKPAGRPPSIKESIDRAVEAVVRAHMDPCARAGSEGQPCFPVLVEEKGPSFSVKDAIRDYRPDGRPAPGVPTRAEVQQQMSGAPASASGGVGGDPVCGAKSLVRLIKGEPNTFFLYRLTKDGVERPLLTDHKVDVATYAPVPGAVLEYMGEFSGECKAVAAWRKALRGSREGPPEPEAEP